MSDMKIHAPGNHIFHINHAGLERNYIVHVPSGYDGNRSLPLVLMLHGAGATAHVVMERTGWCRKSDEKNFIAAFPNATRFNMGKPPSFRDNPQRWNDGSMEHDEALTRIDDIGFITAVIDEIAQVFSINKHHIYLTGFSNGASMTFKFGERMSSRIAAIAPVAGHYFLETVRPERPISIIYITGTDDPYTPIEGGTVKMPWRIAHKKPPVRPMLKQWAVAMGCEREPELIFSDRGVTSLAYRGCAQNAEILCYLVEGLGHVWPGGEPELPLKIAGNPSDKLDGCAVIWDFFTRHPLI
jgi:polyhydroxybutyrate depolymerase